MKDKTYGFLERLFREKIEKNRLEKSLKMERKTLNEK